MQEVAIYIPSSKLALRDLKYINFFKKLSNKYKINLIIDYKLKLNKEDKNYFKNILRIKQYTKFQYILWSISHHLARLLHEEKIFPKKIENQTLGLGKKQLFLIKIIFFFRLEKYLIQLSQNLLFFLRRIHKKVKFNVKIFIAFGSSKDMHFDELIKNFNEKKIKTILITTNWDNATSKPYINKPSEVWTWGKQTELLSKKIYNIKSIAVGTPRFEQYKNIKINKKAAKLKLKLNTKYKYIAFTGSAFPFDELLVIENILLFFKKNNLKNYRLIYRPHPFAFIDHETSLRKINKENFILDPSIDIFAAKPFMQSYFLLNAVEGIICPSSTLLVEAEYVKTPALCVAFNSKKYNIFNWHMNTKYQPHFKIFLNSKDHIFCWDIKSFQKNLKRLIFMKKKNNKNFYKQIVFNNKISYVNNIIKNIERVIH
jgi:hypothetical protein